MRGPCVGIKLKVFSPVWQGKHGGSSKFQFNAGFHFETLSGGGRFFLQRLVCTWSVRLSAPWTQAKALARCQQRRPLSMHGRECLWSHWFWKCLARCPLCDVVECASTDSSILLYIYILYVFGRIGPSNLTCSSTVSTHGGHCLP